MVDVILKFMITFAIGLQQFVNIICIIALMLHLNHNPYLDLSHFGKSFIN